ncbi:hypothetical protein MRB53_041739 [Persea americana]|nr:hypothetical protein MRB53_041739 [Persea americana]
MRASNAHGLCFNAVTRDRAPHCRDWLTIESFAVRRSKLESPFRNTNVITWPRYQAQLCPSFTGVNSSFNVPQAQSRRNMSSLISASLAKVPCSFATCSIGYKEEHVLRDKISAIADAGFTGIELAFPDLVTFASQDRGREVKEDDYDTLCKAAVKVRAMADTKKLEIMLLQPFSNFEGWPKGSKERADAFVRARGWIAVMQACNCKTLQARNQADAGRPADWD